MKSLVTNETDLTSLTRPTCAAVAPPHVATADAAPAAVASPLVAPILTHAHSHGSSGFDEELIWPML